MNLLDFDERLCVCFRACFFMFHQAAYNTTLAFTFCLSKASRSSRGERLGPSQAFPGEVHSSAHVHGLLDPQEYVGVFQRPLWTSHSLALKKIFLFIPSVITASGSFYVKLTVAGCFWQMPLRKGCSHWAESGQIKTNSGSGDFQGPSRKVKWQLSEDRIFLGSSKPFFSL